MYSHTMVTVRPKAPRHDSLAGARAAIPRSMKSKSRIRLNTASPTPTAEASSAIQLTPPVIEMMPRSIPNSDSTRLTSRTPA